MAFPTSPTVNDTYTAASGVEYIYRASGGWQVNVTGSVASSLDTLWDAVATASAGEIAAITAADDIVVEIADGTLRKFNISDLPSAGGVRSSNNSDGSITAFSISAWKTGTVLGATVGTAPADAAYVYIHYTGVSGMAGSAAAGAVYPVAPGDTLDFISSGGGRAIRKNGVDLFRLTVSTGAVVTFVAPAANIILSGYGASFSTVSSANGTNQAGFGLDEGQEGVTSKMKIMFFAVNP
jgi:hypothetical protein